MLNKSLAVGIVFLFIVSSTIPMVLGYDVESGDKELLLENLADIEIIRWYS